MATATHNWTDNISVISARTHAAQADNVTRIATLFPPLRLQGGSLWECVVDYGASGSGADYVVPVVEQKYDSHIVA